MDKIIRRLTVGDWTDKMGCAPWSLEGAFVMLPRLLVASSVLFVLLLSCVDSAAASAGPGQISGTFTYVFPVQSTGTVHFGPYHHDYPATDIFCAVGSRFVSPTS